MPKSDIASMEAKRRELDREIRAAKRAEAKRAKEHLMSEQQSLGVWLAEAVGAGTPEDVQVLRSVLDDEHLMGDLQRRLEAKGSDADDVPERPSVDSESGQDLRTESRQSGQGSSDSAEHGQLAGSGGHNGVG